jgi:hypothetical protein
MVELKGSPKQVVLAELIRDHALADARSYICMVEKQARQLLEEGRASAEGVEKIKQQHQAALLKLESIDSATWWIDNRNWQPKSLLNEVIRKEGV